MRAAPPGVGPAGDPTTGLRVWHPTRTSGGQPHRSVRLDAGRGDLPASCPGQGPPIGRRRRRPGVRHGLQASNRLECCEKASAARRLKVARYGARTGWLGRPGVLVSVHRIRLPSLPSDRGLPQVECPRGCGWGPGAAGPCGDPVSDTRGQTVSQSALGRVPANLPKEEQEPAHLDCQDGPRDRLGNQMRLGKGHDDNTHQNSQGVQGRGSGHLPDRGWPPDYPGQVADVLPELAYR